MKDHKIKKFMTLAGHSAAPCVTLADEGTRKLGAQLLLSEVLEYVISGLGIQPVVKGVPITDPEEVQYHAGGERPDALQMLDGLADVAYTMFWNSNAFGLPLEEGFDWVCDNNLEKFVKLEGWDGGERKLERAEWHCAKSISWPAEVETVTVINVLGDYFAVGKDGCGKVRKPSSYRAVNLKPLIERGE